MPSFPLLRLTHATARSLASSIVLFLSLTSRGAASQPSLPEPGYPLTTNAYLYTSIEALDNVQKLGVGDRVSFRVLEDKQEAKPLVVTDSGELEIPYLGRVKAADKTCQNIAREVKAVLEKELYYNATVILAIDQLNKKRGSVYLVGQVKTSGPVELPSDETLTVSKAILRAGGFAEFADKRHVKITRLGAGQKGAGRTLIVDVNEIFEKGEADKDLKLEAGDTIFIPSRLLNL